MSSPVNYLIAHGAYGHCEENWFPWLGKNLRAEGCRVAIPNFPTPEGQNLAAWESVALETMRGWNPADTTLIGHSAGAVLVLRLAEKARWPFKAIFSVCPFARMLGLPQFDPLIASFVERPFDWQRVRMGAGKITCVAGTDDPYVPLDYSREVATAIGAEFITVEKGGHLNAKAGIYEFPLLLDKIRRVSVLENV
jgi:predicted alpha/beta hydrolase family esterase